MVKRFRSACLICLMPNLHSYSSLPAPCRRPPLACCRFFWLLAVCSAACLRASGLVHGPHRLLSIGYPCVSMAIHGHPWILHGHKCTSTNIHGYPWISMYNHAHPWIPMDIHGYPWKSMDILDFSATMFDC